MPAIWLVGAGGVSALPGAGRQAALRVQGDRQSWRHLRTGDPGTGTPGPAHGKVYPAKRSQPAAAVQDSPEPAASAVADAPRPAAPRYNYCGEGDPPGAGCGFWFIRPQASNRCERPSACTRRQAKHLDERSDSGRNDRMHPAWAEVLPADDVRRNPVRQADASELPARANSRQAPLSSVLWLIVTISAAI